MAETLNTSENAEQYSRTDFPIVTKRTAGKQMEQLAKGKGKWT
jgi:hypothetical protein